MLGEDGRKLQEFYEQLPFGVTIEDFSLVKKRIDQLQESGVHDIELYLLENPDERKKMVRTIQATSANSSMLDLYQVNSFQEYLDLYSDIADWENTGWAESYSQIIANLAQAKSHSSVGSRSPQQPQLGCLAYIHRRGSLPRARTLTS